MNNGSAHGIEASGEGIQVELTAAIHRHLEPYRVSGAQHGTSGNSSEKLRRIASTTTTTKANVATALQMVSWGVEVNDYGNAITDSAGNLRKVVGQGVDERVWERMVAYARDKGWGAGNFKNLNLPIDNWLMAQPAEIRERMVSAVEEFVYKMLVDVFNAGDTAPLAMELLVEAGSHEIGTEARRIEDPAEWTSEKIRERALTLAVDKGPEGDFDD